MSTSAQILDFAAYRARRAARVGAATPRRFLWGWPGQMALIEFPAEGKPSIAGRLGIARAPS